MIIRTTRWQERSGPRRKTFIRETSVTNQHFARRAVSDILRLIDANNQVVEMATQRATWHCPLSSNSSSTTMKKILDLGVRRFEVCLDALQGMNAGQKQSNVARITAQERRLSRFAKQSIVRGTEPAHQ